MLYMIALVLIILWLLGFTASYTMGGAINLLLVFAVILVMVKAFNGRRVH